MKSLEIYSNIINCKKINWNDKAFISLLVRTQLENKKFFLKDKEICKALGLKEGYPTKMIKKLFEMGII